MLLRHRDHLLVHHRVGAVAGDAAEGRQHAGEPDAVAGLVPHDLLPREAQATYEALRRGEVAAVYILNADGRLSLRQLRLPDLDRLSKEPGLTAGMLRDRWTIANPAWPRSAVGVKLNERGWLQELRLCYRKDFMPTACDRGRAGAKDNAPLKIWRGL